jgi:hypothetical protein
VDIVEGDVEEDVGGANQAYHRIIARRPQPVPGATSAPYHTVRPPQNRGGRDGKVELGLQAGGSRGRQKESSRRRGGAGTTPAAEPSLRLGLAFALGCTRDERCRGGRESREDTRADMRRKAAAADAAGGSRSSRWRRHIRAASGES